MERAEPRFLMTDLDAQAEALYQLDGRRMSDKEWFRNGPATRYSWIEKSERFDRFLLSVVPAYRLRLGVGQKAKLDFDPSA